MSPLGAPGSAGSRSFPRVSGDEPITQAVARDVLGFSPRERG